MTKPSRRSSLLQTSDSHSHSHAHSHAHSLFHRLRHSHFRSQDALKDTVKVDKPGSDGKASGNGELESANDSLAKRDSSAVNEDVVVNAVGGSQESSVARVVQTVSLVHYVDPWGSAFKTQIVYATPNTVVVDSKSRNTAAITAVTPSSAALRESTPGGNLRASSSSTNTIHSPYYAKVASVDSSQTQKSAFSSVGDIRNLTASIFHANSSIIASTTVNSSSIYKSTLYSGSLSTSTLESYSTTASQSQTSTTSSITHRSSYSTQPTTTPDDGFATLTVDGTLPSSTYSGNDDGGGGGGAVNLTHQQKQVIGGVVGGIAGAAVIALLLMLFLRYKKRNGRGLLLDSQSGTTTTRSLGEPKPGGGSGAAMAERSAAPGAVASALASLTGKKPPPASPSTATSERGFYRISGKKLPSVLHSGGDGYSNPRASATSGSSDYYRGSQAFEPASGGAGQLALGAPMRPVSGVPVMRSGPARVAITENPFMEAEPPTPPTNLSSRTLPSHDSPRASGSRFHEGI